MALTVREVMDADPAFVYAGDPTERVLEVLRVHELPGVPVVNEGDRCVGIITERDLILSGENEDLHLPHYFQLFGGFVFVERFSHFEDRLRKAVAATAEDLMTHEPVAITRAASSTVARVIAQRKHNRSPVIEHGRLVGVVTRLDVLEALTRE